MSVDVGVGPVEDEAGSGRYFPTRSQMLLVEAVQALPIPPLMYDHVTMQAAGSPPWPDVERLVPVHTGTSGVSVELLLPAGPQAWFVELARLVCAPTGKRHEHARVCQLDVDRQAVAWQYRLRDFPRAVYSTDFGVTDLAHAAEPADLSYPARVAHRVAELEACTWGGREPRAGSFSGMEYHPALRPPYLEFDGPFPSAAVLKAQTSWRHNHGIFVDGRRPDVRGHLTAWATGAGAPPDVLVVPPEWLLGGWEMPRSFRTPAPRAVLYYSSLLARCPRHVLWGVATIEYLCEVVVAWVLAVERLHRLLRIPVVVREYLSQVGVDALCAGTDRGLEVSGYLACHDAVDWREVRLLPRYDSNTDVIRASVRVVPSSEEGAGGGLYLAEGLEAVTLGVPSTVRTPPPAGMSWFPYRACQRVTPVRRPRAKGQGGGARRAQRPWGAGARAPPAPPAVHAAWVPRAPPPVDSRDGVDAPPPRGSGVSGGSAPPAPWYNGVGSIMARVMRGPVSVFWRRAEPGAVVVGPVRYSASLVDSLRLHVSTVRRTGDWETFLHDVDALVEGERPSSELLMAIATEVNSWNQRPSGA